MVLEMQLAVSASHSGALVSVLAPPLLFLFLLHSFTLFSFDAIM